MCLSVLCRCCVVANSLAETGRPLSAIATSSSHIADPANVSANGASSAVQAEQDAA